MTSSFPNIPGTFHSVNDGNLRVERAAPGQKITVLGVTTADIQINEPFLIRADVAQRTTVMHPANLTLPSIPSELNKGIAEVGKGIDIEFVKIAHGFGEEGFAFINETDFDSHIITQAERYKALQDTFDLLLNHNMDMVYICGVYSDETVDLSELFESDGVTASYPVGTGDFTYQIADFCDESTAENQSCISGTGRLPIRIKQFKNSNLKADYFDLLELVQVEITTVVAGTKVATLSIDLSSGTLVPFKGASLVIHYPTGSRQYTIASDDGVSDLTLKEIPIEHSGPNLKATIQLFETGGGDAYDVALTTDIQDQYRRAFRGYHPTDLTSTNKVTLTEYSNYLTEAAAFTNMTNLDGTTATASALYPTNYRLWKATGGAATNSNGSAIDLVDSNGIPIDMGKWMSLGTLHGKSSNSFGDQLLNLIGVTTERLYTSNGMGEYLALGLALDAKESTTNKGIPGFISERSTRRTVLDDLIGKRYIITSRNPQTGNVVAAGNTAAYLIDDNRRSDYTFLTTVKITIKTLTGVRRVINPYIGRALSAEAFRAIYSDLDSMYQELVRDGYIQANYDFEITQTADQRVLGHASHAQVFTPAFELRKVFSETNLSK